MSDEPVEIARCPVCDALPRPSLMGATVCPNGHGDVWQPLRVPDGYPDVNPPKVHETNEARARRGEVIEVTDERLRQMQTQAVSFLHWHWSAAINELIALRAASREEG